MKFERTEEYNAKLFEQAMFDDKRVIRDAEIQITRDHSNWKKLKAFCVESNTYLQFPRDLRELGNRFTADVVEVIREDGIEKYYRAMKGSIRRKGSNEVVA